MISEHRIDFGKGKNWQIEIKPQENGGRASLSVFVSNSPTNNVEVDLELSAEILKRIIILGTRFISGPKDRIGFVAENGPEIFHEEIADIQNNFPAENILKQYSFGK